MEKEQIENLLRAGANPLYLFWAPKEGDPRSDLLFSFVQAWQGVKGVILSDFKTADREAEAPFLAFGAEGTSPKHFYKALPTGLKEAPLLSLIRLLTQALPSDLTPPVEEILSSIDRPLTLRLLIASSCPYCAHMTERVNRFAVAGKALRSWVIDLDLFPEYGERHRIKAVPALVIEDQAVLTGVLGEHDLALTLIRWEGEDRTAVLYRQDLLEKRMDQALDRLRHRPQDLPRVVKLLRDEAFGVKLGAMALLEQWIAEEKALHGLLCEALLPLLEDWVPQVIGDAAYLLGFLQDKRKVPLLRKLLDHPHPEVAEIAREGLQEGP